MTTDRQYQIPQMIDLRLDSQDMVEIAYSPANETLWINVNGECKLRIQGLRRDQYIVAQEI